MTWARRIALLAATGVAATGGGVALAAFRASTSSGPNSLQARAEFPPRLDSVPDVFGVGQVGQTLQASTGEYHPTPTTVAYRWLRCDGAGGNCSPIGATTSAYKVLAGDVGARVRVEATPRNGSTAGAAAVSEPSQGVGGLGLGPSLAEPTSANTPTISGTPQVGSALTLTTGTWSGVVPTFTRRGQRCGATGASCTDIVGETGTSYVVAAADRGLRLRGKVTGTAAGLLMPNSTATADTALVP